MRSRRRRWCPVVYHVVRQDRRRAGRRGRSRWRRLLVAKSATGHMRLRLFEAESAARHLWRPLLLLMPVGWIWIAMGELTERMHRCIDLYPSDCKKKEEHLTFIMNLPTTTVHRIRIELKKIKSTKFTKIILKRQGRSQAPTICGKKMMREKSLHIKRKLASPANC